MRTYSPSARVTDTRWSLLHKMLVLWFAGISMRITIIAIPPVIPQIQRELGLSPTAVGFLTGVPSLFFALIAIPGAALIARFGALPAMLTGLTVTAIMGASRAFAPDATLLFATTFVMSAGVAIMQPSFPTLIRQWMPRHIGLGTSIFSNGTVCGEAIAGALTLPLILPLLYGSWRLSLVFWSLPVLIAIVLALSRLHDKGFSEDTAAIADQHARRNNWWPDWHDPLLWKIGFIVGAESGLYFCINTFIPAYLTDLGHPRLIDGALASLNIAQVPATLFLLFRGHSLATKRWSYVLFALMIGVSICAIVVMPPIWVIFWSAIIGVCCSLIATMAFMLPPLLGEPREIHRLAAGVFTVAYLFAMLIPVSGGISWDVSGIVAFAFAPTIVCSLLIAILASRIHFTRSPAVPSLH